MSASVCNHEVVRIVPLVQNLAGRFERQHGLPPHLHEEVVAEALFGLVEARSRYCPSKGASFSTFMWRRVTGRMRDFVRWEMRIAGRETPLLEQPVFWEHVESRAEEREELGKMVAHPAGLSRYWKKEVKSLASLGTR